MAKSPGFREVSIAQARGAVVSTETLLFVETLGLCFCVFRVHSSDYSFDYLLSLCMDWLV